jgi:hypothetical protein
VVVWERVMTLESGVQSMYTMLQYHTESNNHPVEYKELKCMFLVE